MLMEPHINCLLQGKNIGGGLFFCLNNHVFVDVDKGNTSIPVLKSHNSIERKQPRATN